MFHLLYQGPTANKAHTAHARNNLGWKCWTTSFYSDKNQCVCYASVSCWAQHLESDALACCSHIWSVENHLNDNRFTFGKNCICSEIMHEFIASKGHTKWSMKFRKYCFLLIIFLNEFFISCTMNDSIFLVYACVLVQVTNLPFKFLHLAVQRD